MTLAYNQGQSLEYILVQLVFICFTPAIIKKSVSRESKIEDNHSRMTTATHKVRRSKNPGHIISNAKNM